jgi:hypothetical protein
MDRTIKNTKADSVPQMIWDRIQSKIPGLSDNVLPKRNVFGAPIKKEGNLLSDLLVPQYSTIKNSKLEKELKDLDITISFPSTSSNGVKFNQKEYDSLLKNSGTRIKTTLEKLIESPMYKIANPLAKKNLVQRIVRETTDIVRSQIFVYAQCRQLGILNVPKEKLSPLINLMNFSEWNKLDDDQKLNQVNRILYSK